MSVTCRNNGTYAACDASRRDSINGGNGIRSSRIRSRSFDHARVDRRAHQPRRCQRPVLPVGDSDVLRVSPAESGRDHPRLLHYQRLLCRIQGLGSVAAPRSVPCPHEHHLLPRGERSRPRILLHVLRLRTGRGLSVNSPHKPPDQDFPKIDPHLNEAVLEIYIGGV